MAYREIPEEKLAAALSEYQSGLPMSVAASRNGIHRDTLSRIAKHRGVESPRERSRRLGKEAEEDRAARRVKRDEALSMLNEGASVRATSEKTGLGTSLLYRLRSRS